MKNINLISGLIFLASSMSVNAYEGFACIPSEKETRIQVLVQDKKIEVRVTNPRGYDFMPQFEGPSSPFSISFQKMQAEDLKSLGDVFTYSWPKDKCQLNVEKYTLDCQSEAETDVKGIKSFSLTTSELTEKHLEELTEKRKYRFVLEQGNIYFVTLNFDTSRCFKFN